MSEVPHSAAALDRARHGQIDSVNQTYTNAQGETNTLASRIDVFGGRAGQVESGLSGDHLAGTGTTIIKVEQMKIHADTGLRERPGQVQFDPQGNIVRRENNSREFSVIIPDLKHRPDGWWNKLQFWKSDQARYADATTTRAVTVKPVDTYIKTAQTEQRQEPQATQPAQETVVPVAAAVSEAPKAPIEQQPLRRTPRAPEDRPVVVPERPRTPEAHVETRPLQGREVLVQKEAAQLELDERLQKEYPELFTEGEMNENGLEVLRLALFPESTTTARNAEGTLIEVNTHSVPQIVGIAAALAGLEEDPARVMKRVQTLIKRINTGPAQAKKADRKVSQAPDTSNLPAKTPQIDWLALSKGESPLMPRRKRRRGEPEDGNGAVLAA